MDISVIFATSGRQDILRKTLTSFCELESVGLQWEVLLVDNADEKRTEMIAHEYQEKLPLTYLVETRIGKSFALNTAIPQVKGDVCLITDDDILPDRRWLINTWNGVQRWPNHFLFGGKILPHFPPGNLPVDLEHRLVRGAYTVADWNREEGEYKATWIYGPNTIVRSEVFNRGFRFNTDI
ncbi:MAG: glycosyltransferase, partial [Nitrospirales bacterium]